MLDAKYQELLFLEEYKYCSKLPEFIYHWLGKYEIDEVKKEVRLI